MRKFVSIVALLIISTNIYAQDSLKMVKAHKQLKNEWAFILKNTKAKIEPGKHYSSQVIMSKNRVAAIDTLKSHLRRNYWFTHLTKADTTAIIWRINKRQRLIKAKPSQAKFCNSWIFRIIR